MSHTSQRPIRLHGHPLSGHVHRVELFSSLLGLPSEKVTVDLAPHPTIADVALYSYTAHAPEGGVSLAPYPQLRQWLARIEALPRFVGMQCSAVPEATA
jgi:glutathione S-transferase